MEISELYNLAKQYADMIKQTKPEFVSEGESAVCVIVDKNDQPVTGITSVTVKGGQVELIPAETVAVKRFIDNGEGVPAAQIITMMFKEDKVVETGKVTLAMLGQANPANGDCAVMTSETECTVLRDIVPVPEPEEVPEASSEATSAEAPSAEAAASAEANSAEPEVSMEDLMGGFDVDTSNEIPESPAAKADSTPVGEPAEFADGFSVDESNPFFEEASDQPDSDVVTIDSGVKTMFDHPDDATRQGAAGFQIPQGGYPQQGMQSGYPQQGMTGGYHQQGRAAYPQQGMQGGYLQQGMGYPQQGRAAYPQQGMGYPQQGMGYPQQGAAYPQQGMGGYPQQGAAYPQQGMGYPQQGAAYPQQGMGAYPQGGMPMPGVGQTSVHIQDSYDPSVPSSVAQNLKSLSMDDIAQLNNKAAQITSPSPAPAAKSDDDDEEEEAPMTLEEMKKAASQKKKIAKNNAKFNKKIDF